MHRHRHHHRHHECLLPQFLAQTTLLSSYEELLEEKSSGSVSDAKFQVRLALHGLAAATSATATALNIGRPKFAKEDSTTSRTL